MKPYFQVGANFVQCPALSPAEKIILLILTRNATASLGELSAMTGLSRSCVQRNIKELIDCGILTKIPRTDAAYGGYLSNEYRVFMPPVIWSCTTRDEIKKMLVGGE